MDWGRKVKIRAPNEEKDLISSLPDHLIHQILSLIEIKEAVQTCILSRRWIGVWATLPYLKFDAKYFGTFPDFCKFVNKFLSNRDQYSDIYAIDLFLTRNFGGTNNCYDILKRVAKYAISHNIQEFSVSDAGIGKKQIPSSIFCGASLKKLTWTSVEFNWDDSPSWKLPALTTLQLCFRISPPLPPSMGALTTLCLQRIAFQRDNGLCFEGFINLKNLSLYELDMWEQMEVFSIKSLSLTNLTISMNFWYFQTCKFVVLAPNLSCFKYNGWSPLLLSAEDGLPCLEKVYIHICYCLSKNIEHQKVIFQQLASMFQEIREAKFLTLSFQTIQVLSTVSAFSEYQPSPFAKLNCLKVEGTFIYDDNVTDSLDEGINYLINTCQDATILIQVYKYGDKDRIFKDYN